MVKFFDMMAELKKPTIASPDKLVVLYFPQVAGHPQVIAHSSVEEADRVCRGWEWIEQQIIGNDPNLVEHRILVRRIEV